MIDRRHIGTVLSRHTVRVEHGRLRFFAKATGQTDPCYTDVAAARARGYPDLPVPSTFLFCLDTLDNPAPRALVEVLGIELGRILHGEQAFEYGRMAFAGDVLHFETRVADIYQKKQGALEFVVRQTSVSNELGEPVATLRSTVVIRHGADAR